MILKKPKVIAYDYLFNYFGGDSFNGKVIRGACVELAIHAYKNNEEIRFESEPRAKNRFYNEIFNIFFDTTEIFLIRKNIFIDNLFRIIYGWDSIEAEVVGYSLDYYCSLSESERNNLPDEVKELPCSTPMEVTEKEFKDFLTSHLNDFDISDNKPAQVPSIRFI